MFWLSWLLVGVSIVVGRSRVQRNDGDDVDAVVAMHVTMSYVGDVLVVAAVGRH